MTVCATSIASSSQSTAEHLPKHYTTTPSDSHMEARNFSTVVFSGMEHARKLVDCRKNALVELHPKTGQGGASTGGFPHLGLQRLRSLEIDK